MLTIKNLQSPEDSIFLTIIVFSNNVSGILFEPSHCRKILFLLVMTHNKKNTHNDEWDSNHQDDAEAHPNGVVHFIIYHKYQRAQAKTYYRKNDTTNKFPFPGNDKEG